MSDIEILRYRSGIRNLAALHDILNCIIELQLDEAVVIDATEYEYPSDRYESDLSEVTEAIMEQEGHSKEALGSYDLDRRETVEKYCRSLAEEAIYCNEFYVKARRRDTFFSLVLKPLLKSRRSRLSSEGQAPPTTTETSRQDKRRSCSPLPIAEVLDGADVAMQRCNHGIVRAFGEDLPWGRRETMLPVGESVAEKYRDYRELWNQFLTYEAEKTGKLEIMEGPKRADECVRIPEPEIIPLPGTFAQNQAPQHKTADLPPLPEGQEKAAEPRRVWTKHSCPSCGAPNVDFITKAEFSRRAKCGKDTPAKRIKTGVYWADRKGRLPWCKGCKEHTPEGPGVEQAVDIPSTSRYKPGQEDLEEFTAIVNSVLSRDFDFPETTDETDLRHVGVLAIAEEALKRGVRPSDDEAGRIAITAIKMHRNAECRYRRQLAPNDMLDGMNPSR